MVDALAKCPLVDLEEQKAFRLVATKFPPIELFEDVASAEEFELLYELQAMTNPRIQNLTGNLNLLPKEQIPYGISGCSYAVAPFVHVNPDGSRFADGQFGVLYLADTLDTAISEVRHHQSKYWRAVSGLHYDRIELRGLSFQFSAFGLTDATALPLSDPIYDPEDYSAARTVGAALRKSGSVGLQYRSVRRPSNICWALLSPSPVTHVVQTVHLEFVWDGQGISSVNKLKPA